MNKYIKFLGVCLVTYSIIMSLLSNMPNIPILKLTIRNIYFHVPMWFAAGTMITLSFVYSLKYIICKKKDDIADYKALSSVQVGLLFIIIGILTGSIWAHYTWGYFWSKDPIQNGAIITMIIYMSYIILRQSINDMNHKSKLSAIYNIFSYPIMIILVLIIPRTVDSLHPGSGNNPGFNLYEINNNIKIILYPSILGWVILSIWIMDINTKIIKYGIQNK
ncbi:MAG: cytochrome c biogenesis protein CcsA [Bacteroides sp.]|nr:MAG: cytochrome c biogenesis protein CcsA [Bacteroides sp.]